MDERWDTDRGCEICGNTPLIKEGHFCQSCFDKLQTHYAMICNHCKNYEFSEWTPENVKILAKRLEQAMEHPISFEALYSTNRIVVCTCRLCPKCDTGEEGYYGWE